MDERRRCPRFRIDQVIKISYGEETFIQGSGINISECGVLLETNEPVEPCTNIFLMINLPIGEEGEEFTCEGVVTRTERSGNKFNVAIEITNIEDSIREKLRKYINDFLSGQE